MRRSAPATDDPDASPPCTAQALDGGQKARSKPPCPQSGPVPEGAVCSAELLIMRVPLHYLTPGGNGVQDKLIAIFLEIFRLSLIMA